MKTLWTYAAIGGLVVSLSGTAFAGCAGHGQQTVKADVPMTVASTPTADAEGEKK